MKGINYVTNEDGKRVAVLIDLTTNGQLWEDFFDRLTAMKRANEPRASLDDVKKHLKNRKKSDG